MNEVTARSNVAKNSLHPSESISAVDITALPNGTSGNSQSFDDVPLTDDENKSLLKEKSDDAGPPTSSGISSTGFKVLVLLAVQNCSKNLLLRFVMTEHPKFLTSAAILGVEMVKLVLSLGYIVFVQRRPAMSAVTFIRQDRRNTILIAFPATAYCFQMTLEYVALENLNAAIFSVLVQTKLLATAGCAVFILGKRIKKVQFISLILLTIGVMLCNMKEPSVKDDTAGGDSTKGIFATLGIAASSALASVYTEKVIKAKRNINSGNNAQLPSQLQQTEPTKNQRGLAYTQVQLAFVSLVIMFFYCMVVDLDLILSRGLWYGFNVPACISIFVSSIGGLVVAAVLKYADAVLKGYATAVSVILTGVLSMILFGTHLNILYFLGIANVISAVLLYGANDLDRLLC